MYRPNGRRVPYHWETDRRRPFLKRQRETRLLQVTPGKPQGGNKTVNTALFSLSVYTDNNQTDGKEKQTMRGWQRMGCVLLALISGGCAFVVLYGMFTLNVWAGMATAALFLLVSLGVITDKEQ